MTFRTLALAACTLLSTLVPAAAQYRLAIGDTLLLTLTGVGIERRMTISLDGTVSVPLVGEIVARGQTVADLLKQIKETLPAKSYTIRTADGRDAITVVSADEISLTVAEYRPVYVNGDVARPGELPYRPSMTLRQAIALAGGYDIVRFRIENPAFTTYDLLADYRSVWLDRTRAAARFDWLNEALKQKREPTAKPTGRDFLSESDKAAVVRAETDVLESKAVNYRTAKEAAQRQLASSQDFVAVLANQLKTEDASAKLDGEETDRITDLFRRGTVPANRLADQRRLSLLSSTRVLQVASQLEVAKRNRLDAERELQRLEDNRRLELLSDLQAAKTALDATYPRIEATWEKLRYVTALRSQLVEGGTGGQREFRLVRGQDETRRITTVDEDVALEPGDVVEVRLRVDYKAGIEIKE